MPRPLPIGAAIRAAREAAGLSRREVARRMGCDESQLRAVEAGRHGVTLGSPGGGTLERVAEALRIAPHAIVASAEKADFMARL